MNACGWGGGKSGLTAPITAVAANAFGAAGAGATGAGAGAASGLPQLAQNFAAASLGVPQAVQCIQLIV